jgi:hypothetical protein
MSNNSLLYCTAETAKSPSYPIYLKVTFIICNHRFSVVKFITYPSTLKPSALIFPFSSVEQIPEPKAAVVKAL